MLRMKCCCVSVPDLRGAVKTGKDLFLFLFFFFSGGNHESLVTLKKKNLKIHFVLVHYKLESAENVEH